MSNQTTFARVVDGVAANVVIGDPAEFFHPEIAAEFTAVPVGTEVGAALIDGQWRNPAPVQSAAIAPPRPTVGPNEFYFLWTIPEQVAIDSLRTTDKVVELFMRRLDDPRSTEVVLASLAVQAAVQHTVAALVTQGVIKAEDQEARIAAILSGMEPQ